MKGEEEANEKEDEDKEGDGDVIGKQATEARKEEDKEGESNMCFEAFLWIDTLFFHLLPTEEEMAKLDPLARFGRTTFHG